MGVKFPSDPRHPARGDLTPHERFIQKQQKENWIHWIHPGSPAGPVGGLGIDAGAAVGTSCPTRSRSQIQLPALEQLLG